MNAEDADTPSSPDLVAPCDAASVDGSEVTFVWEPVQGADTYRLQVASTARFEEPVIDEGVGSETAVTVGNQFPTDGTTLFWRVYAGNDAGWSAPGPVESFIATTAAEAEEGLPVDADDRDSLELAGASEEAEPVESFDFADQFEEEKEQGVAYEGVATGQIMGISVSIIVVVLVAVSILFGWFEQVSNEAQTAAVDAQNYEQIRQAELEAEETLQEYGVVNEEEGRYRIPIDRAMDLIATEEYQQRQGENQ